MGQIFHSRVQNRTAVRGGSGVWESFPFLRESVEQSLLGGELSGQESDKTGAVESDSEPEVRPL